jgi:hypothetical protein
MSDDTQKGGSATATKSAGQLTPNQVAVKRLVAITPSPRTADELAASYDGLRQANLWPHQSESSVKSAIKELVDRKVLKRGDKTPDGEPTIELAEKE